MDTYLNLKAFQAAARYGSFSKAARELGLVTSVLTKRINQLEHQLRAELFERTTRRLSLTEAGRIYLERSAPLLAEFDDLLKGPLSHPGEIRDFVRVKAPTSLTALHLRQVFSSYQQEFGKVRLEVILMDRAVDPIQEGFDVSIGAHWNFTFAGVIERPLCPLHRVACASADYIEQHGTPEHPRDLRDHQCLSFIPTGNVWSFQDRQGLTAFEVNPHLASNDGQLLVDAAVNGLGITVASTYMVKDFVRSGQLIPLLEDYPIPLLWLKAVSPNRRVAAPAVQALIERLCAYLTPVPPWDLETK